MSGANAAKSPRRQKYSCPRFTERREGEPKSQGVNDYDIQAASRTHSGRSHGFYFLDIYLLIYLVSLGLSCGM